jgi:5-(carboxyamino)imidazole ribonucleotide synthase
MSEGDPAVSTIGILGGGQLGRMLAVAASRLGLRSHIYAPDDDLIAGHVADRVTRAPYEDEQALRAFAASVDIVTYEFENIPVEALDAVESVRTILPGRNALAVSQDRLVEKTYLRSIGLETAPFVNLEDPDDVESLDADVAFPGIVKTRRFGYDGKGQVRVAARDELAAAWETVDGVPSVLEGVVPFVREVSVIGARTRTGEVVCFDPGENVHREGILRTTTVPSTMTPSQCAEAVAIATRILTSLRYVGVIGVELFALGDGSLVVNEIAPRVHNSGHWTEDGCVVDQFEQHVRCLAGWPIGDGARYADVVMTNLIGDEIARAHELAADPEVALHLYGKAEIRPGRKMGHVNRVRPRTIP